MNKIGIGQRWQSDTESELGLGLVTQVDFRTVSIEFPGSEQKRVYSIENPPITRVVFEKGDEIQNLDNKTIVIESVSSDDGILTYSGTDDQGHSIQIPEAQLNHFAKFNNPKNRLFLGQIDPEHWFSQRLKSLEVLHQLSQSSVRGLYGPRVELIPHQLYIAHTVGQRPSPRVLLADEVGLGKTIEAGMVLHQQVLSGRANRILLLVPETLVHQWLVEMLRRFNLRFSIFDQHRCEAIKESLSEDESDSINPFHTEQLVLCSLPFLLDNPHWQEELLQGQWDLLVVDEAHHLQWQAKKPSAEYALVEKLSQTVESILLLTATPEQLGAASHFARLRLLDPNRFHNLDEFTKEEKNYQPIAKAATAVLNKENITATTKKVLKKALGAEYSEESIKLLNDSKKETAKIKNIRQGIINHLIDRHGTGRVLFRNTRSAISGFPERQLHAYPLDAVPEYEQCINLVLKEKPLKNVFLKAIKTPIHQLLLSPELIYQTLFELGSSIEAIKGHWTTLDPRVAWLDQQLKTLKPNKVLIICSNRSTVLDLENTLSKKYNHRISVFHEGMSIVERDRAAAYFADMEEGAGTLICSEIGSEGRNFQFSHHLILFDLPYIPDLLEQRIGRLDRIGQTETVNLHVPYIKTSPQQAMFQWYDQGLDAFNQTCAPAQTIYNQLQSQLNKILESTARPNTKAKHLDELLGKTKDLHKKTLKQLQEGRDRLLELNSHRKDQSKLLSKEISNWDQDAKLPKHLEEICDLFGVEFEDHSDRTYVIRPSNHMLVHSFPELPSDGLTATFDRHTALIHENMVFLTWEHPMVSGALDLILSGDYGTTALSVVKHPQLQPGDVLLECIFVMECIAPSKLQLERFIPPTPIRIVVDKNLKDYSNNASFDAFSTQNMELDKATIKEIIFSQKPIVSNILSECERLVDLGTKSRVRKIVGTAKTTLNAEVNRLIALQQVNPSVREQEITYLKEQTEQVLQSLSNITTRLDALRLLIAS